MRKLKAAIIAYVVAEFFLTPDAGLVQSHAQAVSPVQGQATYITNWPSTAQGGPVNILPDPAATFPLAPLSSLPSQGQAYGAVQITDQFGWDRLQPNPDGSLNVSTVSTPPVAVQRASGCSSSSAQEQLALPTPPAGQRAYVTTLNFTEVVAAGGTAETGVTWQDVNMSAASTTTTIVKWSGLGTANTAATVLNQSYTPPWQQAEPGQTVSFKSPTTSGIAYCITATFFFGP